MSVLESERLLLRGWKEADFEPFAAFHADPEASRFVGGPSSRHDAWRRFAALIGHIELRGFGLWAVEEKASGQLVGSCGLWFPEGWPELEVGYTLFSNARGNGFATEAAERSRRHAYEDLGATTVVSYIAPENAPSIRVAERLGARLEETIELGPHGAHGVYRHPARSAL